MQSLFEDLENCSFPCLRPVFFHDHGDLKNCENVQNEKLLKEEKMVEKFLLRLFLVCSTRDDSFLFYLNLANVGNSAAIFCLRE